MLTDLIAERRQTKRIIILVIFKDINIDVVITTKEQFIIVCL